MSTPDTDETSSAPAAEPLVSIAMPVYNAARTLELSLRSLLVQTYRNWELLLIDDGSRDATLAVANACTDPRVRVISGGLNAGLATRLNQAIGLARGEFIARMDGDDIAYPERLATQVKFLREHPECDLVGASVLIFDDSGAVRGRFPLRTTHEQICATPWRGFALPHPSWMGRREWFARFGYRPDYRKAEDFDLLLRAYQQSRFACLEDILLGYRQDRRTLKKLLGGRLYNSRSIARESWRQGAQGAGLAGLAGQGVKALADLLAVPMGWDELLRGESADAVTPAEHQAWRAVWTALVPEDGSK